MGTKRQNKRSLALAAFNKPWEMVGRYLSEKMNADLTHFLGTKPYERKEEEIVYASSREKALGSYLEAPL